MTPFDTIINCCKDLLHSFPQAKETADYVHSRLSDRAIEQWEFGYFPNNENLQVLSSLVGDDILKSCDIIYDKIYNGENYRCSTMSDYNLIMPYRNVYGNIIGIVGRSILSDNQRKNKNISKYKNTHFAKRSNLFGLNFAKKSIIKNNLAVLCEGQIDVIQSSDKGLENVVALGSSGMAFEQLALLMRYTNNIILLLDNDDAGQNGESKIIQNYGKYANIKRAQLPKGYNDLDQFFRENELKDLELII
jgi:DNA primase